MVIKLKLYKSGVLVYKLSRPKVMELFKEYPKEKALTLCFDSDGYIMGDSFEIYNFLVFCSHNVDILIV